MIPTLARPGDVAPGQFGPIKRAPAAWTRATAGIMSSAGIPSVIQKIVFTPAAAASITRGHADDDVRSVLEHRRAVERALAAGQAVDDDPAPAVDQDAHAAPAL